MERFRILPVVLALIAISLVSVHAGAQAGQGTRAVSSVPPAKVRRAAPRPMPFPPGVRAIAPSAAVQFRAADQMTPQDRNLEADAESSIAERAGFAGLEFNQGQWSYRQIVCSALPQHLFLQFMRNSGRGDVSLFSASIPRSGDGRVRIIPIVRRGYSLFSPAPINALTISAFNHIRAEENQVAQKNPDAQSNPDNLHPAQAPAWLATGLCYAALAGAHPEIGPANQKDFRKLPAAPTGRLVIPLHGGAIISFTDIAARRPMLWTMMFNGKGKLLKATHSVASRAKSKTVERTPTQAQGKPVQAVNPETKAILIK